MLHDLFKKESQTKLVALKSKLNFFYLLTLITTTQKRKNERSEQKLKRKVQGILKKINEFKQIK